MTAAACAPPAMHPMHQQRHAAVRMQQQCSSSGSAAVAQQQQQRSSACTAMQWGVGRPLLLTWVFGTPPLAMCRLSAKATAHQAHRGLSGREGGGQPDGSWHGHAAHWRSCIGLNSNGALQQWGLGHVCLVPHQYGACIHAHALTPPPPSKLACSCCWRLQRWWVCF